MKQSVLRKIIWHHWPTNPIHQRGIENGQEGWGIEMFALKVRDVAKADHNAGVGIFLVEIHGAQLGRHRHVNFWMRGFERVKSGQQPFRSERSPDAERKPRLVPHAYEIVARFIDQIKGNTDIRQVFTAALTHHKASLCSNEQAAIEVSFEQSHLPAHGSRGDTEFGSRAGYAAMTTYRFDSAQRVERRKPMPHVPVPVRFEFV